jgi:hypothetical protein
VENLKRYTKLTDEEKEKLFSVAIDAAFLACDVYKKEHYLQLDSFDRARLYEKEHTIISSFMLGADCLRRMEKCE